MLDAIHTIDTHTLLRKIAPYLQPTHTQAHARTRTHTPPPPSPPTHVHTHSLTHSHSHAYTHTNTHTNTRTHTHTHTYVHTNQHQLHPTSASCEPQSIAQDEQKRFGHIWSQMSQTVTHSNVTGTTLFLFLFMKKMVRTK